MLRVIQLTDTHLFSEPHRELGGVDTEYSLGRVLEEVRKEPDVDLILLTGDLVHDGSEAAYRRLFGYLRDLGTPVHCLPGNHDEGRRLREMLDARTVTASPVRAPGHLLQANWQIILLDSSVPGDEGGRLGEAEFERLGDRLQQAPELNTLVCVHHHPVPMQSRWLDTMQIENSERLLAVLQAQPQVRGLVWGHVHQEYDAMHGDLRLLATPSTCAQFLPRSDEFALDPAPPGYRRLTLYDGGELETDVVRVVI